MILINSFCSKANKVFLTFSLLFIIRKQSPKWRLNPKFYLPGKSFSCIGHHFGCNFKSSPCQTVDREWWLVPLQHHLFFFSISLFYAVVEFHTILWQYWDFTEKLLNRGDAFIFRRIHCKAHSNGIYAYQHVNFCPFWNNNMADTQI